jgi:HEAT repeat protein
VIITAGCNTPSPPPTHTPGNVFATELIPQASTVVRESLLDDNRFLRPKAAGVVAATNQVQLMPSVQRLLRDDCMPVRFVAAVAVGDTQYSLAEGSVRQLLNDKDENVRIAAAYALYKLGYADSFMFFRNALGSRNMEVRANAAWLLGKSGSKEAFKPLWWALWNKDSDDKVVFNAAEAIAALGDEKIYPKLWTMLISVHPDVRVTGIRAMGALGTPRASNDLVRMLTDDVLEVRLVAAEQLGKLGDPTGEPVVLDVFQRNVTAGMDARDLERVHVLTAKAIGQIGTPRLTKFLPLLLRSQSKFVRLAAAEAVFQSASRSRTTRKLPS